LLEDKGVAPQGKDTFADIFRNIDDPAYAVVELEIQTIVWQDFDLGNLPRSTPLCRQIVPGMTIAGKHFPLCR
jgi:hypothetical protein